MSVIDWAIVLGAAAVGWALVSGLVALIRQQRAPPYQPPMNPPTPSPSPTPAAGSASRADGHSAASGRLSIAELDERWPEILGVPRDAAPAEIDTAYRTRLAQCEQVLSSPGSSVQEQEAARERRVHLNDAFKLIRPRAD